MIYRAGGYKKHKNVFQREVSQKLIKLCMSFSNQIFRNMRSLTEKHCKSEYNTQHGQVEHNIVSQSNTTPNSTAVQCTPIHNTSPPHMSWTQSSDWDFSKTERLAVN